MKSTNIKSALIGNFVDLDRGLNLNELLMYGCGWVCDRLKTNPHVSEKHYLSDYVY